MIKHQFYNISEGRSWQMTFLHLSLIAIPLGDFVLWGCAAKPFRPGSVIDSHIWLPTQVCCQGNMAGCHPLAAGSNQWLGEVHLLLLEHALDLLCALLKSFLSQEIEERHVQTAWDVAWFEP